MARIYHKQTHCKRGHELTPGNRKGGSGQCKMCITLNAERWKDNNPNYRSEWRNRHRDRLRLEHISSRYGLSSTEYNVLLEAQERKCAICCELFSDDIVPHVDHCHVTGKVRGLLCRKCNSGLGQFEDSPERLNRAVRYVEEK